MKPTHAIRLINSSKMKTLAMDNVQVTMVTSRANLHVEEKDSPRIRYVEVPPKETSFFLPSANLQSLLTPR
jgi:hypothetical protein